MGLTNGASLDAANTAFNTAVSNIFSNTVPSIFQIFTDTFEAEGESVEILVIDGLPRFRRWGNQGGAKQTHDLRSYSRNYPIEQWEATFSLPGTKVRGDKTGIVGQRVGEFSGEIPSMLEEVVIDALVANPTCYDGVSLLNSSHPNVATGGTADNISTSALSFSEYDTAKQALKEMADEKGKYLGLVPTHLLVGTAQERVAMEVTGSDRPYSVGTAGALNTGGIGAVTLPNYYGGDCNVLVTPYITGNEWFLMCLNKPVKPFGLAMFRSSTFIPQEELTSPARFNRDTYVWSIEADMTPVPQAWQCIYGSVTA